ncbi:MAG TPA: hypothetical protein VJZ00_24795 [Thermoanaerobaculia bacterium]|nr:hypothetical protein [Thermoanaerobaculia bacterium]
MTPTPFRLSLALAGALTLAPVTAHATIARAMNFDDKVENAASIVVGRVVNQRSQWDASHKLILTYTTFRVEKMLKGMPAQEVTVVTPGGTVGNIAQDAVGIPRFHEGDDHVVFVRNTNSGPTVLYFEQGAYSVVDEGNERMVKPLVSEAVLMDTQRGIAVAPESPRTLREFENNVRETIRHREAIRMELIEKQKKEAASIGSVLRRNWLLVMLAIVGGVLATLQLLKRW